MSPRKGLSPAAGLSLVVAAITVVLGMLITALPLFAWPAVALAILLLLNLRSPHFALSGKAGMALISAIAILVLGLHSDDMATTLRGWKTIGVDHLRLHHSITMFPERLWGDRPQRILISAPRSQQVTLQAPGFPAAGLPTVSLGAGLFRWDYDPHSQGIPTGDLELVSDRAGTTRLKVPFFPATPRPAMLCSDPASGIAATVSESTDEVWLAYRDVRFRRFKVGYGPTACDLFDHGTRLAVGHRYDQTVWVLDTATGQPLAKVSVNGMVENLAVSPSQKLVAVLYEGLNPGLAVYELPGLRPVYDVALTHPGELLCFGADDNEIVVASLRGRCLMRLQHGKQAEEDRALSMPATALCRATGGKSVYIASTSGMLDGGPQSGNHFIQNVIMQLNLKSWDWTNVQATESRHEEQPLAGSIDSGVGATDIKAGPHNELLVTFSGSHEVARLPMAGGLGERIELSLEGLLCPLSTADLGQGVHIVSFPAQQKLAWLDSDWDVKRVLRLAPDDDNLHDADYNAWFRRQGEVSFYETTNAGISCQSCHARGDSDYAVHDIGGAQMWGTLSLQGIAGTAPYLRDASYPSLADLHSVALLEYRGYRRDVEYDRGEAIGAFIEGQSLPVNPRQLFPADNSRLERERRGVKAFVKAQCVQCHAFPATTNLAAVPNQTLFPGPEGPQYYEFLDVPSLRAVWRSAPYLHDGRAATLEDVMNKENPHNQHGDVAGLSSSERSDLVEFLRSL